MPDYETYAEQSDLCAAKLAQSEAARVQSDIFAAAADACAKQNDTEGEALNIQAAVNQLILATSYAQEAKNASDAAKAALEE